MMSEHFYPSIYLKKVELQDVPERFEDLEYPSIVDYDLKFGDNFSYQLYNRRAEYTFEGITSEQKTYYTMAIIAHSYGLTDVRKPDFKLTVTSVEKIKNQPTVFQAHELKSEEKPLEILQI